MARTMPIARTIAIAILLGGALAGCGGRREAGPAWPKLHATETAGGESLAPQGSSVAAIEEAEDVKPSAPAPAAAATTTGAAPSATPAPRTERPADPPAAREPDVLTTEEIIIEIDD